MSEIEKALSYFASVDEATKLAIQKNAKRDLAQYEFFYVDEKAGLYPPPMPRPQPIREDFEPHQVFALAWNDITLSNGKKISYAIFEQKHSCLVFDPNAPRIPYK